MADDKKTIEVFCASEQKETLHEIDINGMGEVVLTCISDIGIEKEPKLCGRFLKFPQGTDAAILKAHIANHKIANTGQISVTSLEIQKKKLIDDLFPSEPAK